MVGLVGRDGVVVLGEEGIHLGRGHIWERVLADGVAHAGNEAAEVGVDEVGVGLRGDGVEGGDDGVEGVKYAWGRGGSIVEEEDDVDAAGVGERAGDAECWDDSGFVVWVVGDEGAGGGQERARFVGCVDSRAAPDLTDCMGFQDIVGDDGELVAAAFERPEEVRVVGGVGVGDCGVG